jgi:hypothetical protein
MATLTPTVSSRTPGAPRDQVPADQDAYRDMFAGMALEGLITNVDPATILTNSTLDAEYREKIAVTAWAFADAMIKAR